jgi:hypothetical protein
MASVIKLAGAPLYSAMVPHFRRDYFLLDRGGVGISPGQSSTGGDQQKGARDVEPIGTSANGCGRCFLSSVWPRLSSGGVTTARRWKGTSSRGCFRFSSKSSMRAAIYRARFDLGVRTAESNLNPRWICSSTEIS